MHTPLETKSGLSIFYGSTTVDATIYQTVFDTLQYISITRSYVIFVVHKLSHFMIISTYLHWTTEKCVLWYLKGTLHHGLFLLVFSSATLQEYFNVDWAPIIDNHLNINRLLNVRHVCTHDQFVDGHTNHQDTLIQPLWAFLNKDLHSREKNLAMI